MISKHGLIRWASGIGILVLFGCQLPNSKPTLPKENSTTAEKVKPLPWKDIVPSETERRVLDAQGSESWSAYYFFSDLYIFRSSYCGGGYGWPCPFIDRTEPLDYESHLGYPWRITDKNSFNIRGDFYDPREGDNVHSEFVGASLIFACNSRNTVINVNDKQVLFWKNDIDISTVNEVDITDFLRTGRNNATIYLSTPSLDNPPVLKGSLKITRRYKPQEPPIDITPTSSAFSPNSDGKKDSDTFNITSQNSWTLSVDGYPGMVGSGIGSQEFIWDGKVNSSPLPDGRYTIRLKAGSKEKTADVTIDRIKPRVLSADISGMNDADSEDEIIYLFDIVATDVSPIGATSGINPSSGSLAKANSALTNKSSTSDDSAPDTYQVKVSFPRENTPKLAYTVSIEDNAGNTATLDDTFVMSFEAAGDYPIEGEETAGPKKYETQSLIPHNALLQFLHEHCHTAGALNPNKVYYSKIGVPLHYCVVTAVGMLPLSFPVPTQVEFKKKSTQVTYGKFNYVSLPNPFFGHPIMWDGSTVPEGEYEVVVTYGGPGISSKKKVMQYLQPFKVSNIPVISENEWKAYSPINLAVRRAGHILHRHILDGSPAALFSDFDPSFKASRPPGYTELDDFMTQELIGVALPNGTRIGGEPAVRPIFDNVVRIGRAVIEGGKQVPRIGPGGGHNPTAIVAPVVLRNQFNEKVVVFVRDAVRNSVEHWTIFPDTTSQTQYEKSLK